MTEPSIDEKLKLAEVEKTLAEAEKLRSEGRAAHRELDEKLKLAEIDKTLAETEKLRAEGRAAHRHQRIGDWTEPLKLFGAVVLGIGGAVAAYTQYEVAEMKKTLAESKRVEAENGARAASVTASAAEAEAALASQAYKQAAKLQRSAESAASTAQRRVIEADERASAAKLDLVKLRVDAAKAVSQRDAAAVERDKLMADVGRLKTDLASTASQLQSSVQQVSQVRSKLDEEVLAGLKPEAADLARRLLDEAAKRGIKLRLFSGYRSPEQQAALYAQGRTAPGRIVTNARLSVHSTGLAFDVGIIVDGQAAGSAQAYEPLVPIATALGLVRPDRFDPGHFETQDAKEALATLPQAESH